MAELLHAGCLAVTGFGACCVALEGPRPRIREFALSLVMVLAMLDVVFRIDVLPIAAWSALIIVCAMVLAVRRHGVVEAADATRMRALSSLGGILMAALMLAMSVGSPSSAPAFVSAHHGGAVLVPLLVMASFGYTVASIVAMRRTLHRLNRVQLACMAGSTLLLAVGHLTG